MDHSKRDFIQTVATISTWVNTDCERRQNECTQAIQELIDDLGIECVMRAIGDTKAGNNALARMTGEGQFKLALGMLREIQRAQNMPLCADLLAMAIGDGERAGMDLGGIAKHHGRTKACASKLLIGLVERLNLPRLSFQLDAKARKSYSLMNRRNHGRAA